MTCETCFLVCCSKDCLTAHCVLHEEESSSVNREEFSSFFKRTIHKSIFLKSGKLVSEIKPNAYFDFDNFEYVKVGGRSKRLGKGAFGEVYKMQSRIDGKFYAMKHIEKCRLVESGMKSSNIRKEIDIHLSLEHDNIVKLHSFHENSGSYYLVVA